MTPVESEFGNESLVLLSISCVLLLPTGPLGLLQGNTVKRTLVSPTYLNPTEISVESHHEKTLSNA